MKRRLSTYLPAAFMACWLLVSCSKWDDFKKYQVDGETLYTGKLDSIRVFSGNERVKLRGVLMPDPKIAKVRITWNDGADSLFFPIDKGAPRLFEQTFPVSEGVKSFRVHTFDAQGNISVPVNAIGTSYGTAYKRKLTNRNVTSAVFAGGNTTINWDQIDFSIGAQYTETEYVVNGVTLNVKTPVTQASTVLTGFNTTTTKFRYRTVFRPDTSCIDYFYTDFVER
ncbi:DUF4998 domain-containing protein [Chitinophaga horti]|uniref:DUF4998 domain-containing protein n=1 Tax=Chitinophaga horti TaxID=2920382 RepID=A0ABY6J3U6_9BACT|nr:DUF4998 domain-containing protein [Chitinophaga horti]UYQ94340.1 DUF4998 domain-containing protein [Chitinophaga horti]